MGKLNIAHHKSYHPYRRDNIERVRRDEEEAQQKEAQEEGRMMLADSEARIDQLRERAGITGKGSKKKKKEDIDKIIAEGSSTRTAVLPTTGGHINFFEDLEQNAITAAVNATKKTKTSETDKGVPLAPSAKDLKPWYSERIGNEEEDTTDERRLRDSLRKSVHDPLTSITRQLATRESNPSSTSSRRPLRHVGTTSTELPELEARLTRESSERERALALIRKKRREMDGSETPSVVHGGAGGEYADMFNRKEVEEAHRWRDRWRDFRHRAWDDERRR